MSKPNGDSVQDRAYLQSLPRKVRLRVEAERLDAARRRHDTRSQMPQEDDVLDMGTAAEAVELRALLRDVVVAADRMRDRWSEADKAVQNQLWRALHTAAEAAYDHVYPLPGADPDPEHSDGAPE